MPQVGSRRPRDEGVADVEKENLGGKASRSSSSSSSGGSSSSSSSGSSGSSSRQNGGGEEAERRPAKRARLLSRLPGASWGTHPSAPTPPRLPASSYQPPTPVAPAGFAVYADDIARGGRGGAEEKVVESPAASTSSGDGDADADVDGGGVAELKYAVRVLEVEVEELRAGAGAAEEAVAQMRALEARAEAAEAMVAHQALLLRCWEVTE